MIEPNEHIEGDGELVETTLESEAVALRSRTLRRITESLVFSADAPVTADRIADVYAEVTGDPDPGVDAIMDAVHRLNASYEREDHALRIERWAGGFRIATVPDVAVYVKAFLRQEEHKRLSRTLLETLAIIAYRQPVTRPEVDFVRGVDSDYAFRRLMELGLVDVAGRSESLGRPLLYATTRQFLDQFGLNSLDELPSLREIEDLLDDPAFNRERARLLELDPDERPAREDAPAEAAGTDPTRSA